MQSVEHARRQYQERRAVLEDRIAALDRPDSVVGRAVLLEQLHPGVLRLLGDLDLAVSVVERVPHHQCDGLARFDEVVGDVRDQVGALGHLHDEQVGEAVHVHPVLGAHAVDPVLRERAAVEASGVVAGAAGVVRAHLEA